MVASQERARATVESAIPPLLAATMQSLEAVQDELPNFLALLAEASNQLSALSRVRDQEETSARGNSETAKARDEILIESDID